ncbi:MAG: cyclic nucleotide-binding domain-containing protein [Halioglobus sp.]
MGEKTNAVPVVTDNKTSDILHAMLENGTNSASDGPNPCQDCYLQHHCLVSDLDTQSKLAISAITDHPKPFQKSTHIYRQNSAFRSIYIVRSGAVKTYYLDEDGEENISGFYLAGEMFGFDGVGKNGHRYSAQALDTTAVCSIKYHDFEKLFAQHPRIQQLFTSVLCNELYARQQPLLRLRQHAAEECLTLFLLDISERLSRSQKATEFTLPMPRRDIARYLSLAEETLSRLFRRLQDKGPLRVSGRKVTHFDEASFRAKNTSAIANRQ